MKFKLLANRIKYLERKIKEYHETSFDLREELKDMDSAIQRRGAQFSLVYASRELRRKITATELIIKNLQKDLALLIELQSENQQSKNEISVVQIESLLTKRWADIGTVADYTTHKSNADEHDREGAIDFFKGYNKYFIHLAQEVAKAKRKALGQKFKDQQTYQKQKIKEQFELVKSKLIDKKFKEFKDILSQNLSTEETVTQAKALFKPIDQVTDRLLYSSIVNATKESVKTSLITEVIDAVQEIINLEKEEQPLPIKLTKLNRIAKEVIRKNLSVENVDQLLASIKTLLIEEKQTDAENIVKEKLNPAVIITKKEEAEKRVFERIKDHVKTDFDKAKRNLINQKFLEVHAILAKKLSRIETVEQTKVLFDADDSSLQTSIGDAAEEAIEEARKTLETQLITEVIEAVETLIDLEDSDTIPEIQKIRAAEKAKACIQRI